jgi:two-component system cell cycle sensor histidine kinase/response regulator CckA
MPEPSTVSRGVTGESDTWARRDEFLRRAFEDAPIGTALVGLDERIIDANAALCAMLGYTREQILTLTVPQITHPDDRLKEAKPKGDMHDGRSNSFVIEKRYVRADGSMLLGRLSVSALYDADDKPAFFIGQLEDVTRERAAEDALRSSEALFRALVESTTEIFCVIGAEGSTRFVSPTLHELLGWSPQEQQGRPFVELVHEDDRAEFEASFAAVLAEPTRVLRTTLRMRHRGQGERFFDLVGRNRLEVEALAGVVVTLRDVTESRTLQAQLARAQRLDSLGRLAGGVAHDFNNVLGVILGMTNFLEQGIEPGSPLRDDVAAIEEAALRARDLTAQLLAVGRRQHGAPRATDVHAHLCDARRLLDKVLGDDVELRLDLQAEAGCVIIDPTHFEQIILNLATNARDAMPRGGHFTAATRSIEREGRRWLELRVSDGGEGMSAETREHIFDPFFTTKEQGRGTGLGLATVYGIVRQAEGDIRVDSEPGRGTCFTLGWPEVARPELQAPSEVAVAGSGTGRVLLVEDDDGMRATTARILEQGGYQVVATAGAEQALAHARTGAAIDVVVTDVVMPQTSGPELYERLVAERGPLPVVFVSGYAKAAQSDVAGHPGFLAKPFTPAALLAKVRGRLLAGATR